MADDDVKQCPFCAEQIKREAKICRYCHMDLASGMPVGSQTAVSQSEALASQPVLVKSGVATGVKVGFGMFIVLPLLIILVLVFLATVFGAMGGGQTENSRKTSNNSEFTTLAEKHNRGWHWAQDRDVRDNVHCQELEDGDERHGCEIFAERPVPKFTPAP